MSTAGRADVLTTSWLERQNRCEDRLGRMTLARRSETDSSESESNIQCGLHNLILSGGDALRGNTRPHPEHDG